VMQESPKSLVPLDLEALLSQERINTIMAALLVTTWRIGYRHYSMLLHVNRLQL
jgi:hypothetical protein